MKLMTLISDIFNLYKREMIIFRANIFSNIIRSIIFPLVLIVFLGGIGNTIFHISVAIVNYADNPQSFQFISQLQSNNVLSIKTITSQNIAMNMLHSSNVSLVIVILPTFPNGSQNIDVYYNNNNFQNSMTGLSFIQSTASKFINQKQISVQQINAQQTNPQSSVSSTAISGTKASYKDFLFAGILIMVTIFGSTFNGGISLIKDKDTGILKSFLMSPISKLSIILSKILSGITQSTLYVFIAILIGVADGVTIAMLPWFAAILWILLFTVLISILFSCVAIILAIRIPRVEVFTIIVNAITLPLWFLSGAFFPASSLPSLFKPFNTYNPLTYAVNAIRNITMLGYLTMNQIAVTMSIIIIGIVVLFVLAFKLFKTTVD